MFVRMSAWKCSPDYWGEDSKLFESSAVKIMQKHKGFIQAMLLAKPNDIERIAFTIWDSADDYKEFVESPDLDKIIDMFAHMYLKGGSPKPTEYEVRAKGNSI